MKIGFSTTGCPDFDWNEICSMAKDLGFSGIELRGLGGNMFVHKGNVFGENEIEKTILDLKRRNLEIPCISSGCALRYLDKREETVEEIKCQG